jgi:Flp pilus assembly protein TadD
MPAFRRALVFAATLAVAAFFCGKPGRADDDSADAADDPADRPAASASADDKEDKDKEPDLKQVLERLNRLERELLELRIKSGKVPQDKKDQRVITLMDTPYLGSVFFGSPTNQRFFAARLTLVNLTEQPVVLKRDDIKLVSDGQTYPVKEPPQQFQFHQFQIGQQAMQLKSLQTPAEVQVPVGGTSSAWALFPELPPGSHVPPLVVQLKFGDTVKEIDVNAAQREVLGMKIDRLGPRGCLGMIRISGMLNTINAGSLVEELDRFTADRLVRAVIAWEESGSISDPPLTNWLQNAALSAGRAQQFNEQQFPALPSSLRELHLARLPNANNPNGPSAYPSNFVPATAAITGQRLHKTDIEAVVAALRSAYEVLSRDEVLQAVQTGNRFEKAAALACGAGRLGADKLSVVLKYADDLDPILQQAALTALSHFGEVEAVEKLVFYSRKNVEPLSGTAIAGLAGSRYAAAHQALLELLSNEAPESKKNIVRILAAYPRPVWSEAIYEFVKDARSGLNVEALNALVQVGHPKLIPVLADALKGTDETLKQQAFTILAGRADPESEELALEFTLAHLKTTPATTVMLQLLNRVKDKRALPLLMARFPATQNKQELIQTLALIGDEQTAKFLVEKYPTLQNHEKGEILRLLVKFDLTSFRKLAAQALQSGDGTLVSYSVQGLQEDGGAEAVKIMIDALDTAANSFTWSYLSNALASAGTPAARAALLKARDSGNAEKRNFAVNALQIMRQRSPGYQHFFQGQQLAQQEKFKESIEQYDLAIQLDATLSEAYSGRGHSLLHLEKYVEAGKDFAKALEHDPYNSLAVAGMCLVLVIADGKPDEAVKKIEESRGKFPNDGMFCYNAACVYGRAYAHVEKDEKAPDREKVLAQYKQAAFADLKKSIELGFQDFELMKKDPDLKSFQELPEFQELMKAPPQGAPNAGVRPARNAIQRAAVRRR